MTAEPGQFQLLLKAFYQKIQKLNADFKIEDINLLIKSISSELCNDQLQIDFKKFKNDENYLILLNAYCVALSIRQAFSIFEEFKKRSITEIIKPGRLLPNGWTIIDGGQE